jgi:hypothetical protein
LSGKSLDAAATLTFQFGFCSILVVAGYLIPFLFGDPDSLISIYLLAISLAVRTTQTFGYAFESWTTIKGPTHFGIHPPGKTAHTIQNIVLFLANIAGCRLLYKRDDNLLFSWPWGVLPPMIVFFLVMEVASRLKLRKMEKAASSSNETMKSK